MEQAFLEQMGFPLPPPGMCLPLPGLLVGLSWPPRAPLMILPPEGLPKVSATGIGPSGRFLDIPEKLLKAREMGRVIGRVVRSGFG